MIKKIAAAACVLSFSFCNAQMTVFKKGDRVAFTGNSITDGGHYHSYIWLYYMTRFPNERIDIFNSGIGGDVAGQMYQRLDDDVLSHKPTVITLTFGMNDVGYYDFLKPKPQADSIAKERIKTCYNSYKQIEARFKALPNVKKILIVSSPYDETVKKPNNLFPGKAKAMLEVADFQQAAAKENGWGFVDFNRPMTAINEAQQKEDSTYTLCGNDRIHPGNDGHMVMAYTFLKAQGLANKDVADVTIDALSKTATQQTNCTVSDVKATANNVSFTYLANSLPYPIDTIPRGWMETRKQSDALKLVPFTDEFNREMLTVKGLVAGKTYKITIDSSVIGTYTGSQLQQGINLALCTIAPQYKQALRLMYLNEERWEIERRLRQYYWLQFSFFREKGLLHADTDAALDTLDANMKQNIFLGGNRDTYLKARFPEVRQAWRDEMDLLVNRIYTLNKPVKRTINITAL